MKHTAYILTQYADDIETTWELHHDRLVEHPDLQYLGGQLERCPTTQRLHWQAFAKFSKQVYLAKLKKLLPTCHFTPCPVERMEAIGYGIKEESRIAGPKEYGIKPSPTDRYMKGGMKTKQNWDLIKKSILEDDKDAIPPEIVLKYNLANNWSKLQQFWTKDQRGSPLPPWLPNPWGLLLPSIRKAKKRHYWIWSQLPNAGKTTLFAQPLQRDWRCHIKSGDFSYWNVTPEIECVILDDYNCASLKFHLLNQMCDGSYEYRIFHGGVRKLKDPLIIILSNCSISSLYPFMHSLLLARFIEIEVKPL